MGIKLHSVSTFGLEPVPITVEVVATTGLPQIKILGLNSLAAKESKDRVLSALKNLKVRLKARRTILNLSAGNFSKSDHSYELAIAVGLLALNQEIHLPLTTTMFLGEVSVEGSIQAVSGCLAKILAAKKLGFKQVIIPIANKIEGELVSDINVYAIQNISQLLTKSLGSPLKPQPLPTVTWQPAQLNLRALANQQETLRALTIALAGKHHLRLVGPPGVGKTVLPQIAKVLQPPLDTTPLLEVIAIHTLNKKDCAIPTVAKPPFQLPAHSVKPNQLISNFNKQQVGELALAQHGVIFFDELSELSRTSLQVVKDTLDSPSNHCLIIAASNPCPCGYWKTGVRSCHCSAAARVSFNSKLSGSFLDRFDLHVAILPNLNKPSPQAIEVTTLQKQINTAVQSQATRYQSKRIYNGQLNLSQIDQYCQLTATTQKLMNQAMASLKLSMRSYQKVLTVARTIADLEGADSITEAHIAEALNYRFEQRWDP